jgi:catechol 2,3-dioxygenase-like lactoylglutathione lyase family enzyme
MDVSAPFEPAIVVTDFDACLAFYRDVLGMRVVSIDTIAAEPARRAQLTPGGYRIVRLQTMGGDRLKLVTPAHAPARNPAREFVMERAGFAYLTFIVPDLRPLMEAITRAGAQVITGPEPVAFRPGVVDLFFARDPEGNFLEFVQRNDLATYRPELQPRAG